MAEAVAMRAMFVRLGFSAAAATAIVDTQGIDTLEEVYFLSDDEAEGLCSVIHKPGGTIPNPNAGAAGQPATIPDPGETLSLNAPKTTSSSPASWFVIRLTFLVPSMQLVLLWNSYARCMT